MIYQHMIKGITPLYRRIYQHPFNLGLYRGSLAPKIYNDFLQQDRIYLGEFSMVLGKIATRFVNSSEHRQAFEHFSAYILKTEKHLHDKYLIASHRKSELSSASAAVTNYTHYLHHMAESAPLSEAVASCLPCFCIYSDLGVKMKQHGVREANPYRLWIESYSSKQFLQYKELMVAIACEIAEENSNISKEKMIAIFKQSTLYEIALWDSVCSELNLNSASRNLFFKPEQYLKKPTINRMQARK